MSIVAVCAPFDLAKTRLQIQGEVANKLDQKLVSVMFLLSTRDVFLMLHVVIRSLSRLAHVLRILKVFFQKLIHVCIILNQLSKSVFTCSFATIKNAVLTSCYVTVSFRDWNNWPQIPLLICGNANNCRGLYREYK